MLSEDDHGYLVATMHSIATGLSLTQFTEVVYAELDWRPAEVAQSMARYHRISGNKPVNIRVLVLEGTLEEQVADAVLRKLSDASKIVGSGIMERELAEALEQDDEDFFAEMREVAAGMVEEDVYL
jgi:SNF2 family DNA or RNA helicase